MLRNGCSRISDQQPGQGPVRLLQGRANQGSSAAASKRGTCGIRSSLEQIIQASFWTGTAWPSVGILVDKSQETVNPAVRWWKFRCQAVEPLFLDEVLDWPRDDRGLKLDMKRERSQTPKQSPRPHAKTRTAGRSAGWAQVDKHVRKNRGSRTQTQRAEGIHANQQANGV
jgi:hypothetical protein